MKLTHTIGRVLKSVEGRAGRRATFGTGVAVPFVARLPGSGSRAPTSVSHGGCDHRVVAVLNVPQGVPGLNRVLGCLVVPAPTASLMEGGRRMRNMAMEKICVWRNSRRQAGVV